jgi:protein-S-isoprenylcysteine O-methyltransferase Ste14
MNNLPKLALLMIIILAGIAVAWLGGITAPNNRLGWFMLVAGLSSCLVGLLHDRSLWLIFAGFLAISLIPPLEFLLLPATLPRTALMEEIGLLLLGAGLLFYLRSRYAHELWDIGGNLSNPDPSLTTAHIHQLTRFLVYMGLALLALGVSVGYSSLIGLCAILLLLLPAFIHRIALENKYLSKEINSAH